MAKSYSIKNVTGNYEDVPARPIGLVVKADKNAPGTGNITIPPSDAPVILTEEQYKSCKAAIDIRVKAHQLEVKEIVQGASGIDEEAIKAIADKLIADPDILGEDGYTQGGKPRDAKLEAAFGREFNAEERKMIARLIKDSKSE